MYKKVNLLWPMLLLCFVGIAQSRIEVKVFSEDSKEPLVGATVYIEKLKVGLITDFNGFAVLEEIPAGEHHLKISFLGFENVERKIVVPQEKELIFFLKESSNVLDGVVLQSSRSTRTIKKIPTRIEFIGGEELGEKAVMNPANISVVLRESTGIQMQQTSLSSGNTNIKIQGLDGRYTQLLRDGFPIYGGFSSGLSILQIPPLDLKQFEIIKGSSSTLYGGGAIAGLVNLVSKTPTEDPEMDIMLTQTQALGSTMNIFYGEKKRRWGWTLYGSGHYQKAYDPEKDDFSNLPKTFSVSFNPKLFYYPSEDTRLWFGINATYDDRKGGDVTKIEDGSGDIHQYTEKNNSKRVSVQTSYKTQIDMNRTFRLKNSMSYFQRNLEIPNQQFKGYQWNSFTEAVYQEKRKRTDLVLGANLYTANFNEQEAVLDRDQNDITYGLFTNYIYDFTENWILETGLRTDYAKDWGVFALPRVSLLYSSNTAFSSRIGGGLGYKIPDIFTEEAEVIKFRNVLPIDKDNLNVERSYGINIDFNYKSLITDRISFSVNQLFYLTAIKDGLLLNSTDNDMFHFENANGNILSKGAETNVKFTFGDFRWFMNFALIDTRLNYLPNNPQKPLTAKYNAGSVLMYESDKWRVGYEAYYTGKQILSSGFETTDYISMGLLTMRNFDWGSMFVNFENFTDRRQSRFSPLVLPPHESPIFPEIYAPTDGFIFSIGMIVKPFGNESHD